MSISFRSIMLPCSMLLLASMTFSCKDDPVNPIEPNVPPPTDTIAVIDPPPIDTVSVIDPPEENVDSIVYGATNQTIDLNNSSYQQVIDSLRHIMLTFEIKPLSSGYYIKVIATGCELLDNSTHGYPDALAKCTEINSPGYWFKYEGLISTTVGHGGQFQGKNDRFLAIRFKNSEGKYQFGWARLSCNGAGNMLTISDFGYRTFPDLPIYAGQKSLQVPCTNTSGQHVFIEQIEDIAGEYHSDQSTDCVIQLRKSDDPAFDFTAQYFPFMWPYHKIPGKIVDGKLKIQGFHFEGNVPTPGGMDRLYSGDISGSGELFLQNGKTIVIWQINYDKSGFMSQSFHGEFFMEHCE